MLDILTAPSLYVHAAAICYVIALGIRDQLYLRLLILAGTGFYITYYLIVVDTPLWEAALWSILMAVVNFVVIVQIIRERSTFTMGAEERQLFDAFVGLAPGEFRRLMALAHWQHGDGETVLTHENQDNNRLYYVLSGTVGGEKHGRRFSIEAPSFLGEVSLVLDCPATATITTSDQCRYIYWERADIEALQRKKPSIAVALSALLKIDLARKVAAGHAPTEGLRVVAA
ncbi:MAG: cyclic nucleotide-binding domain-containing protein [Pseudomonadota bacterium]